MKTILSSGAFQKIYNPSVGETHSWYINDHCFIRDKTGLWHMFGITQQEPAKPQEEKFFAHATSRNILNPQWEKQEPVLRAEMEKWGETLVWAPHIVENNGRYFIFYCAGGQNDDRYKIHLATSSDLWSWERHEANPMVVDGYHARDPMVIQHQGVWIMYYTANRTPSGGQHVVAAVTSKDLIHWEEKREVFVHPQSGTYGGPTESPFVVQKNGKFYLFVCTNTPYNDSAVYESLSPFEWKIENQVGRFPSHASEVIHLKDEDQYYISRAGWGQGGLYLAELFWNESSAG
jgi:predicted GH43/DUF377 family glycosyl hydrolase